MVLDLTKELSDWIQLDMTHGVKNVLQLHWQVQGLGSGVDDAILDTLGFGDETG